MHPKHSFPERLYHFCAIGDTAPLSGSGRALERRGNMISRANIRPMPAAPTLPDADKVTTTASMKWGMYKSNMAETQPSGFWIADRPGDIPQSSNVIADQSQSGHSRSF
jgi:hypothetical protein